MRKTYVYQLIVEYPEEPNWDAVHSEFGHSNDPAWAFRWPRPRKFLSQSFADRRAHLLRRLGCEVTVVRSEPVTFPSVERELDRKNEAAITGLQQMLRTLEIDDEVPSSLLT